MSLLVNIGPRFRSFSRSILAAIRGSGQSPQFENSSFDNPIARNGNSAVFAQNREGACRFEAPRNIQNSNVGASNKQTQLRRKQTRTIRFTLICLILANWLLVAPTTSVAQDDNNGERTVLELSKLDTFLKNKDGSLIQYFNITFDEFKDAYDAIRSQASRNAASDFSIRKVDVVVEARALSAAIEMELTVIPKTDATIDVPIGFDNGFFSDVDFNRNLVRKDKQYFVRFQGKADQPSTIKLKSRQSIQSRLGGKQILLKLPPSVFSKVVIHETEGDLAFSADQNSIAKTMSARFSGGTSFQFEGLKETAEISWSKKRSGEMSRPGKVDRDFTITAEVDNNRILYEAKFSLTSSDPLSQIHFNLPDSAANVQLKSETGTLASVESEKSGWQRYQVDIPQASQTLEEVEVSWSMDGQGNSQKLQGILFDGFELVEGQLVVRSVEPTSFVLSDRQGMADQSTVEPNRHYTYSIGTLGFSATVFSVFTSPKNQEWGNLNVRLGAESSTLELLLPTGVAPQNPGNVSVELNGWKLVSGQSNLEVDSLTRQVNISPVFFLKENQTRRILFSIDQNSFGETEFRFPRIKNFDVDGYRIRLSCTEDVNARIERSKNPSLNIESDFESEIVTFGKTFGLTSQAKGALALNLRLDPVLPFVEGKRDVRLKESRGRFIVESNCTIKSSREFDAIALIAASDALQVKLNREIVDIAGLAPGTPFVIDLDESENEVTIELSLDLGDLTGVEDFSQKLTEFLLPTIPGSSRAGTSLVEAQGRNFVKTQVDSTLNILTPSGTQVEPDSSWTPIRTGDFQADVTYEGKNAKAIQFRKTILSDEDVYVKKLWCHTSLNSDFRQDRVVIRFIPRRSVVRWQIPEGTKLVSCQLNGKSVGIGWESEQSFVETRFEEFSTEHLIEFNLRFFYSSGDNLLSLKLPKTNRLLWSQDMYWSLHLPDNQYVLNYSNGLSGAYVLDWTGFFLQPAPKLNIRQLERWIAADHSSGIDRQGNEYLFSTFGIGDERSVYIISKRNLVLVFGLFFITLGCAFVSLSFMRNSIILVAIAAGILIFGMWYPIWFVQLLQIEIFVGFLFGVGFILTRFATWISPAKDETRIETNVPSLVFAAPDSGMNQSAETRGQTPSEAEEIS